MLEYSYLGNARLGLSIFSGWPSATGVFFAFILCVALSGMLWAETKGWRVRFGLVVIVFFAAAVCLMLTYSRGAILGALIGIVSMGWLCRFPKRVSIIAALLFLISAILVPDGLERFSDIVPDPSDVSVTRRFTIWGAACLGISKSFPEPIGMDRLSKEISAYWQVQGFYHSFKHALNQPLTLYAQYGWSIIPLYLAIPFFGVSLARILWKRKQSYVAVAAMGIILCFSAASQFTAFGNVYILSVYYFSFVLLAFLVLINRLTNESVSRRLFISYILGSAAFIALPLGVGAFIKTGSSIEKFILGSGILVTKISKSDSADCDVAYVLCKKGEDDDWIKGVRLARVASSLGSRSYLLEIEPGEHSTASLFAELSGFGFSGKRVVVISVGRTCLDGAHLALAAEQCAQGVRFVCVSPLTPYRKSIPSVPTLGATHIDTLVVLEPNSMDMDQYVFLHYIKDKVLLEELYAQFPSYESKIERWLLHAKGGI